jgi:hypothetical protein
MPQPGPLSGACPSASDAENDDVPSVTRRWHVHYVVEFLNRTRVTTQYTEDPLDWDDLMEILRGFDPPWGNPAWITARHGKGAVLVNAYGESAQQHRNTQT